MTGYLRTVVWHAAVLVVGLVLAVGAVAAGVSAGADTPWEVAVTDGTSNT